MQLTHHTLEIRTIFTPFGIRFWDPLFDRAVTDDLVVTARPAGEQRPVVPAFRTRSGVYAFQGLPGLQTIEYPPEEGQAVASLPVSETYLITVIDSRRRFIPVAFAETLPLPYRGVYPSAAPGSLPDDRPPGFYLFSAPTRPPSPGLAVVRSQLLDEATGAPAAYAVVTVQVGSGEPWYGLADEQGRVAIFLPYPTFAISLATSPPSGPPPSQQSWPVTVQVYYEPAHVTYFEPVALPDFRAVMSQAPALIYPTDNPADPPLASWPADLMFGQELVLRTAGLASLLISPVASLP